jgi:hypothetical protein
LTTSARAPLASFGALDELAWGVSTDPGLVTVEAARTLVGAFSDSWTLLELSWTVLELLRKPSADSRKPLA